MLNPLPAFIPAIIWAVSPIYYRVYLKKFDYVTLNFIRTVLASTALFIPALIYGFNEAVIFAIFSGIITIAVGDTLFLVSIKDVGASIAAPVAYTYVLFIQFAATLVGERFSEVNLVSALLVVLGISLLSKGEAGHPRIRGIVIALGTAAMWTTGQALIKLATNAGVNFLAVAFARNAAAASVLGSLVLLSQRNRGEKARVGGRELFFLAVIAISDLAIGSAVYVYSVIVAGIAITAILTSISPLLTQIFSRLLGKETPTGRDIVAGLLIVLALIIAVIPV